MILTNTQINTLQRVVATANQVLLKIEWLEAMAGVNTALRQRVSELRSTREYLVQLANTGLEVDRQMDVKHEPRSPGYAKQ